MTEMEACRAKSRGTESMRVMENGLRTSKAMRHSIAGLACHHARRVHGWRLEDASWIVVVRSRIATGARRGGCRYARAGSPRSHWMMRTTRGAADWRRYGMQSTACKVGNADGARPPQTRPGC
nr:hypothetical protein CFP56_23964 [Quercus suber]